MKESICETIENECKKECKSLKVSNFNDLVELKAIVTPKIVASGLYSDYMSRKNKVYEVDYLFDEFKDILKPILKDTYGIVLYKEQFIDILKQLGNFSIDTTTNLCEMIDNKNFTDISVVRSLFISSAHDNCYKVESLGELFDLLVKFYMLTSYRNKSQLVNILAIDFAILYLKTYYPNEFSILSYILPFRNKNFSLFGCFYWGHYNFQDLKF